MKKLFTTLLAVAAMSSSLMAESVSLPYKSDMFTDVSQMDEGWSSVNNSRKGKAFEFDRDNTGSALATPGTKSAACHSYDSDNAADCWLFSPEVALKAGGNYTIGIWAKSKGSDAENFKICYGSEASVAAMTSTILDCPDFENPDDYVFKSAKLVPTENMTVRFGINCYSPANRYVLSVTGFTVSDENGNTDVTEKPVQPSVAAELPFTYDFTSSADFAKNWTTGRGEDSEVPGDWEVNEYSKWVALDDYNNKEKKENNWLISQPLNFAEAGAYALKYTGLLNGKLEFLIGTATENLDGYTSLGFKVDESYSNDEEYTLPFSVVTPGEYRIAVRACADAHTFMGYRMKSLTVRSDKPVPALVSDLTAMASPMDELEVNLTWTNPAVDHLGNTLADITKLELYRNGTMIKDDFSNLTPDAFNAWVDCPETPGVYSYHVIVYNANGCSDGTPMEVSAGFVGRPTAEMPYKMDATKTGLAAFTFYDANNDGSTWTIYEGYSSCSLELKVDEIKPLDDYAISPYLHLTPGYYKFRQELACKDNQYEAGLVTNRHNPKESFIKLDEVLEGDGWLDHNTTFIIEEEGDYALCIHAIGESKSTGYLTVTIRNLELQATSSLPKAVTDLKAEDAAEGEGYTVTLSWTNPTVDNAGKPLDPETSLKAVVKWNDGSESKTIEDAGKPGEAASAKITITEPESYTFSVTSANANGESEDEAPEVSLYVGPVLDLPYATTDFTDWEDPSNYYWSFDDATKQWSWDGWWAGNYHLFSPYLRLEAGKQYIVEAIFDGHATDATEVLFQSSLQKDNYADHTEIHNFTLAGGAKDFAYGVVLAAAAPEAVAALAEEEGETTEEKPVAAPAGKMVLSFRPNSGGKITLKSFSIKENTSLGIDAVEPETSEAPAEYYTLQGIRVDKPRSGIYILRQGNKATKVIL